MCKLHSQSVNPLLYLILGHSRTEPLSFLPVTCACQVCKQLSALSNP